MQSFGQQNVPLVNDAGMQNVPEMLDISASALPLPSLHEQGVQNVAR